MGSYFTFLSGCFVGGGFCLVGFWLGFSGFFIWAGGVSGCRFFGFFLSTANVQNQLQCLEETY